MNDADIEGIDMAFHAGAEWFTNDEKVDLLYLLAKYAAHIRILVNTPEASELLAKHMRHQRKSYMSFEQAISLWTDFGKEHPNIEMRVVNIPILRRYYSFHMKDASMDTVNVKYYTYANPKPNKNYQPIFYRDSEYFELYREEFTYLWQKAISI